jgi:RNA recognition motif-containing protein
MLERHFSSVRPVHGIKLPTTKFDENKGFAFIYYGSEDDANLAKKELDRTAILIQKIRVTKTVVSENLSKMIFKIKVLGLNDKQIQEIQSTYFNEDNLEKEVDKIISPIFGKTVEINKIIVPAIKATAEKKGQTLSYARVFFYISNLKEAVAIVRRLSDVDLNTDKNEYEQVLEFIMNHLNKEETFRKNATAEIYEYTKKNRSNVLHLKGVQSS